MLDRRFGKTPQATVWAALAICLVGGLVIFSACGSGSTTTTVSAATTLASGATDLASSTTEASVPQVSGTSMRPQAVTTGPGPTGKDQQPTTTERSVSTTGGSSALPSAEALFADLAARLAPVPVYAPGYLPGDAEVAGDWWPVTQLTAPSEYRGKRISNPRVDLADGVPISAEVVVRTGDGWLDFLENFRGDLGDVEGEDFGTVQGHRAMMYSVNGGRVVQWSHGGLWFAVFARGVPTTTLSQVVKSMAIPGS